MWEVDWVQYASLVAEAEERRRRRAEPIEEVHAEGR